MARLFKNSPLCPTRRRVLRLLGLACAAVAVGGGVAACGRKQRPTHPEGGGYPRTYPTTKETY